MTNQEWMNGTSIGAVKTLIGQMDEILAEMGPCPEKLRLERVCHGLERELKALQQAVRDSDEIAEYAALKMIASKITRYYRILGTYGRG